MGSFKREIWCELLLLKKGGRKSGKANYFRGVFEVTWFEDAEHPQGGKRLITRAFAAVGAFEDDV